MPGSTVEANLRHSLAQSGIAQAFVQQFIDAVEIAGGVPAGADDAEEGVGFGARIARFRNRRHIRNARHPRLVQDRERPNFSPAARRLMMPLLSNVASTAWLITALMDSPPLR